MTFRTAISRPLQENISHKSIYQSSPISAIHRTPVISPGPYIIIVIRLRPPNVPATKALLLVTKAASCGMNGAIQAGDIRLLRQFRKGVIFIALTAFIAHDILLIAKCGLINTSSQYLMRFDSIHRLYNRQILRM